MNQLSINFEIIEGSEICVSCPYRRLSVKPLFANGSIDEIITCEHQNACERAYNIAIAADKENK